MDKKNEDLVYFLPLGSKLFTCLYTIYMLQAGEEKVTLDGEKISVISLIDIGWCYFLRSELKGCWVISELMCFLVAIDLRFTVCFH